MLGLFISSNPITHGSKVALAVSGGADSLCMTLLFTQANLYRITVLIVDHKLRPESTAEAEMVRKMIREKFNVECVILTWDRNYDISSNIQAQARDSRYKLLTDYCKENDISYLCTAHNSNDQAETVLMNIMRGTGLDGLVAIRESAMVDGLNIIRPMLKFSRNEIEDYLRLHSLEWINDPSNQNKKYERVKVRNFIKKIESSRFTNSQHFISRMNLLAENAARMHDFVEDYVSQIINRCCKLFPLNVIAVDPEYIANEKEEIILRVFRSLIKMCSGHQHVARQHSLMRLYRIFSQSYKTSQSFDITLGGCIIWYDKKILVFKKENCRKNIRHIAKNEMRKIILFLQGIQGKYKVTDPALYERLSEMINFIPKPYKALYGEPVLKVFADSRIVTSFPSLGITEI